MASMAATAGQLVGLTSTFNGGWENPFAAGNYGRATFVTNNAVGRRLRPIRSSPVMKNVNEGKGVFAPLVVITRDVIGKKTFNKLRGKAIALHSQVITEFCKAIGADAKQRQGLIRLAKKNGEKLGFLA